MLEELHKMFELNISRSFNLHDVDQNMTNHHIIVCVLKVSVYELAELIFIHVSRLRILLIWASITQILLLS